MTGYSMWTLSGGDFGRSCVANKKEWPTGLQQAVGDSSTPVLFSTSCVLFTSDHRAPVHLFDRKCQLEFVHIWLWGLAGPLKSPVWRGWLHRPPRAHIANSVQTLFKRSGEFIFTPVPNKINALDRWILTHKSTAKSPLWAVWSVKVWSMNECMKYEIIISLCKYWVTPRLDRQPWSKSVLVLPYRDCINSDSTTDWQITCLI